MVGRIGARAVGTGLVLALAAAGCGGSSDGSGSGDAGGATGTINISGSSTVQPISSLVAEIFNEDNPDVQIRVDGPGTGDGFALFCAGETDISDASRPIDEEEATACEQAGVNYVELEVALDGVTVMTSPPNEAVSCLSTRDLYALFGPESDGIDTWNGADALAGEVGGTGGFPDAPLEITAPGEESGTYDAFIELAGIADVGVERGLSEDDAASLRKDYQPSPNDNVIIQAIEGSDSGLGFVGFAFAEEAAESVKEVAVDAGQGCVEPSVETIGDGSYPLSRSLFIYVNTDTLAKSEALGAFVDFYLSDTGLSEIVPEVGYVALPADRIDATRAAWADVTA
jgi:phosphate transport system substrate-binding protein